MQFAGPGPVRGPGPASTETKMAINIERGTYSLIALCAAFGAAWAWHAGNLNACLNGAMIALFSLSIALDPAFVRLDLRQVFAGSGVEPRSAAGAELCFWLAMASGAWLLARALPGA